MMDTEAMTERMTECACLRAGEPFVGKQGFTYAPAISAETVGRARHPYATPDDSARRAGKGAQAREP